MKTSRRPKSTTPDKVCLVCGRPFSWRRKWARDWALVKTCSDRCKLDLRRGERADA
ncbi:DUF2256 domain-containing protein [Caulobacter sp. CCNWLY153]|uniref:DUF2256 domain-containing protein n=1 Tax=Caulobacter radicis TaxID=2172650 RepID=A0A2T9JV47_9CAUL|nr:DUF2256 domain-containing protein [Caulobacter radicis]PVM72317.1 DUF2256 domain-containing protein [Caulobacter radicis]PVM87595.1 DUF2256 domain-containing protein [Caulobacter radicis]